MTHNKPVMSSPRFVSLIVIALLLSGTMPALSQLRSDLVDIPYPELSTLEPGVQEALRDAQEQLERLAPDLGQVALTDFYGQLGMLYHAHQLLAPAEVAYRNATMLTPDDSRWVHLRALALEDEG